MTTDVTVERREMVPPTLAVEDVSGDVESTRHAGDGVEGSLGTVEDDDVVDWAVEVDGETDGAVVGPWE